MSSYSRWLALVVCAIAGTAFADESPQLGEPVGPDRLAQLDYTVLPDGDGLPAGSGSAREGAQVFRRHCIACHGENATGGVNDALAGGHGTLDSDTPKKTVGSYWPYATTLLDYVRRAMPLQAPGTLEDDELYAVTAYLLFLNGIIAEDATMDAESLPIVRMPNRDGFSWAYSP
jgi:cytochrome c